MPGGDWAAFLNHEVAAIIGVTADEVDAMSCEELEARLDLVRLSREPKWRRGKIRLFALRCRLRGEPHVRVVSSV